ncbi:MAG: hypothetical protein ABJD53_16765 [Gammaproteobacteria bacterium]
MRRPILSLIGVAVLILAVACDRAKSPEAAANDIAAAKQDARQEVADAHLAAAKDINGASKELQDKSTELAQSNAKAAYDIALARADGDHKVAIQQCMTQDGDPQKQCKGRADAEYDVAKANAKATLTAQHQ